MDALPHTIALAIASMLLATLLAIPLGVLAATRPGSLLDRVLATASIVAIAIPSLVAGLGLLVVFGVQLELFPIIGTGSFSDPLDYLHHLALPSVALALAWIGYLARLLRASLVEELGRDLHPGRHRIRHTQPGDLLPVRVEERLHPNARRRRVRQSPR